MGIKPVTSDRTDVHGDQCTTTKEFCYSVYKWLSITEGRKERTDKYSEESKYRRVLILNDLQTALPSNQHRAT